MIHRICKWDVVRERAGYYAIINHERNIIIATTIIKVGRGWEISTNGTTRYAGETLRECLEALPSVLGGTYKE